MVRNSVGHYWEPSYLSYCPSLSCSRSLLQDGFGSWTFLKDPFLFSVHQIRLIHWQFIHRQISRGCGRQAPQQEPHPPPYQPPLRCLPPRPRFQLRLHGADSRHQVLTVRPSQEGKQYVTMSLHFPLHVCPGNLLSLEEIDLRLLELRVEV